MQMLGLGSLESVQQARELVRRSYNPVEYLPKSPEPYDQAATPFNHLLG
jgi:hypothetical protein